MSAGLAQVLVVAMLLVIVTVGVWMWLCLLDLLFRGFPDRTGRHDR